MKNNKNDILKIIEENTLDFSLVTHTVNISNKKLLTKLIIILESELTKHTINKNTLFKICVYMKSLINICSFTGEEKTKFLIKINNLNNNIKELLKRNNCDLAFFSLLKMYILSFDFSSNKKKNTRVSLLIELINSKQNVSAIAEFSKGIDDLKHNNNFSIFYNALILETIFNIYLNNKDDILYNLFILKMFNNKVIIKESQSLSKIIDFLSSTEKGKNIIYFHELKEIVNHSIIFNRNNIIIKYNLKERHCETPPFVFCPKRINKESVAVSIDNSEGQIFKDDAISLKRDGNKEILGIHISDVGVFTYKDKELNQILLERFKSLYFLNKNIYLFPKLSDISKICSLNKNAIKQVISLYLVINEGIIEDYFFKAEQIKIIDNLSYYDVENIYTCSNKTELKVLLFNLKSIIELINNNMPINQEYRKQKSYFSASNEKEEYNLHAHKIVEECMILFNYYSAKLMDEKNNNYIYRNLLPVYQEFEDKSRTLNKSEKKILYKYYLNPFYSIENLGHIGINKEAYSHSSSPLRRYVDLYNQYLFHYYFFKDINSLPINNIARIVDISNQREKELALCKYEFLMK